jgi:hypothetical protein
VAVVRNRVFVVARKRRTGIRIAMVCTFLFAVAGCKAGARGRRPAPGPGRTPPRPQKKIAPQVGGKATGRRWGRRILLCRYQWRATAACITWRNRQHCQCASGHAGNPRCKLQLRGRWMLRGNAMGHKCQPARAWVTTGCPEFPSS